MCQISNYYDHVSLNSLNKLDNENHAILMISRLNCSSLAKALPILMDVPHRSAAAHKRDVLDRGRT